MNKVYWFNKDNLTKWETPKYIQFPFNIEKVLRCLLRIYQLWKGEKTYAREKDNRN
jgi:hypothetical protein